MIQYLAEAKIVFNIPQQDKVDLLAQKINDALYVPAKKHFGTKLVGPKSKAWIDSEVILLHNIKKTARDALVAACRSTRLLLVRHVLCLNKQKLN